MLSIGQQFSPPSGSGISETALHPQQKNNRPIRSERGDTNPAIASKKKLKDTKSIKNKS
jgi:hypothetical protein